MKPKTPMMFLAITTVILICLAVFSPIACGFVSFLLAPVCLVIAIVQTIRKRQSKSWWILFSVCFVMFWVGAVRFQAVNKEREATEKMYQEVIDYLSERKYEKAMNSFHEIKAPKDSDKESIEAQAAFIDRISEILLADLDKFETDISSDPCKAKKNTDQSLKIYHKMLQPMKKNNAIESTLNKLSVKAITEYEKRLPEKLEQIYIALDARKPEQARGLWYAVNNCVPDNDAVKVIAKKIETAELENRNGEIFRQALEAKNSNQHSEALSLLKKIENSFSKTKEVDALIEELIAEQRKEEEKRQAELEEQNRIAAEKKAQQRKEEEKRRLELEEQNRISAEKEAKKRRLDKIRGPKPESSAWDGAVPCVKLWLKKNMKDPESFDLMESSPVVDSVSHWTVRVKYRAKNSFGGFVIEQKLVHFLNNKESVIECTILGADDYP